MKEKRSMGFTLACLVATIPLSPLSSASCCADLSAHIHGDAVAFVEVRDPQAVWRDLQESKLYSALGPSIEAKFDSALDLIDGWFGTIDQLGFAVFDRDSTHCVLLLQFKTERQATLSRESIKNHDERHAFRADEDPSIAALNRILGAFEVRQFNEWLILSTSEMHADEVCESFRVVGDGALSDQRVYKRATGGLSARHQVQFYLQPWSSGILANSQAIPGLHEFRALAGGVRITQSQGIEFEIYVPVTVPRHGLTKFFDFDNRTTEYENWIPDCDVYGTLNVNPRRVFEGVSEIIDGNSGNEAFYKGMDGFGDAIGVDLSRNVLAGLCDRITYVSDFEASINGTHQAIALRIMQPNLAEEIAKAMATFATDESPRTELHRGVSIWMMPPLGNDFINVGPLSFEFKGIGDLPNRSIERCYFAIDRYFIYSDSLTLVREIIDASAGIESDRAYESSEATNDHDNPVAFRLRIDLSSIASTAQELLRDERIANLVWKNQSRTEQIGGFRPSQEDVNELDIPRDLSVFVEGINRSTGITLRVNIE